jgi:DNA-dependent RNA polymerase auxiliary subunit epsilon
MKEISEQLHEAFQESKRIDHLIYVSLKYTRTVDVILSIVKRMIEFFNYLLDALLEYYKEKGKVDVIQKSPGLKCDQLRSITDDEKILKMIDFYLLLRKLARVEYGTINEYKRHVGMIAKMDDDSEMTVDIDLITEYYGDVKDYLDYVNNILLEKNGEDD